MQFLAVLPRRALIPNQIIQLKQRTEYIRKKIPLQISVEITIKRHKMKTGSEEGQQRLCFNAAKAERFTVDNKPKSMNKLEKY